MPSRIKTFTPFKTQPTPDRRADQAFYKTPRWAAVRLLALRTNPVCKCGRPANMVHHDKGRREFPELAYVLENLISICGSCHSKEEAARRKANNSGERV